ncbi:MAG: hypothetical protein ACYC2H_07255 [Thermoplasmatota archaeon]
MTTENPNPEFAQILNENASAIAAVRVFLARLEAVPEVGLDGAAYSTFLVSETADFVAAATVIQRRLVGGLRAAAQRQAFAATWNA